MAPALASTRQRQNKTTGSQARKTTPALGLQLQGCQLGQLFPLADSSTVQESSLVSWKTPCTGPRTLFVFSASGEPHAGHDNTMKKGLSCLDQIQSLVERCLPTLYHHRKRMGDPPSRKSHQIAVWFVQHIQSIDKELPWTYSFPPGMDSYFSTPGFTTKQPWHYQSAPLSDLSYENIATNLAVVLKQ